MKNILFDMISAQGSVNGGAEYTIRILNELVSQRNHNIICLYDSHMHIDECLKMSDDYQCIDINAHESIAKIVDEYQIDTFFIGIAQRYCRYNMEGISCHCVVVIHDVGDLENAYNGIYKFYPQGPVKRKSLLKKALKYRIEDEHKLMYNRLFNNYEGLLRFMAKDNVEIVTVSDHSKSTLNFFFDKHIGTKRIHILYPPLKKVSVNDEVENDMLRNIIEEDTNYFLVISAHRIDKNADLVYRAFEKFHERFSDFRMVAVGGRTVSGLNGYIPLPLLSASDLEHAYAHAFAFIYPSLQEGFGYPPLEAMRHSVPSIIANVCSMPDIYREGVFFSPFYANDLYRKMNMIHDEREKHITRLPGEFARITRRMQEDLQRLMNLINGEYEE